ncbi:adenine phosphoribosyltransferase [Chondromyces apiculatus]|uniref:Adenine phosphoribosyltransferase n=1 Tax=Chondromyces apiculatus DSM 436 TaxID=1192034 RepID=A0A017SWL0_9BACT|nr:adenine phosphoribosyltransferase [Chondromyces apiculatus]EYF00701.1 Adenine phosphoribosyltransferase [Chondromyces apiculatus DSM 436]
MFEQDALLSAQATRYLQAHLRDVPDFPRPGILFKDITPLLAEPRAFHMTLDLLVHPFIGRQIDAVIAIESRGFLFGGALAARLNASLVPVRKAGKLPAAVDRVAYALEYGEAELEMHKGSLRPGAHVLIVDDVLATGGTAAAAATLARGQHAIVAGFAFVIELDALLGRSRLAHDGEAQVHALIHVTSP